MRTFEAYELAGFAQDLLPILPHDAKIHPGSPAIGELSRCRGKVPGKKQSGEWFGFGRWPESRATPVDLKTWSEWGAGVGMLGRRYPAIDIDVDHSELADAIHREAVATLGLAPVRFGRGSRRILVYACEGLPKRRLAFSKAQRTSSDDKTTASHGDGKPEPLQAVELLGDGQQYVVEGVHPRTKAPYYWTDNRSPAEWGAEALSEITPTQLDEFFGRVEGIIERFGYSVAKRSRSRSGCSTVLQESLLAPSLEAVRRALAALPNDADYDEWINVMVAVKAATGGSTEGFELFADWSALSGLDVPETTSFKYDSFDAPYQLGWDWLARLATDRSDGAFHSAHEDFEAVQGAEPPTAAERAASRPLTTMFARYVWIERLKRVCDMETGDLLDREQFNVRMSHIGPPTSTKECAWAVLTSNPRRLQTVKSVTYRPGADVFVVENMPGLVGRCVNRWRDPCADLPAFASGASVQTWLDHVAFVIPDERERGIVLDWLAWIVQHPGEKPNWALVIGSTVEGIGKDLMIEPVRVALGHANVREIGPDDLASGYTDFIANTRLLLVEEMEMSERKALMNRLKSLVSAPPYTLRVNAKYEPQYEVPNIVAAIFFTNLPNALALPDQARRYLVTWNEGQPREASYYEELVNWFAGGGAARAARWLLSRDVSTFNAKGRAPDTAAKRAMRRAALPDLEAAIVEGLMNSEGPFIRRLITVGEVAEWVQKFTGPFRPVAPRRLVRALKTAGAIQFDRRPSLGNVPPACDRPHSYDPKQVQLFAKPGDMAALELLADPIALREQFWSERLASVDTSPDDLFGGAQ